MRELDTIADSATSRSRDGREILREVLHLWILPGSLLFLLAASVLVAFVHVRRADHDGAQERFALTAEQAARRLEDFIKSRLLVVEVVRKEMLAGLMTDRSTFEARTVNLQREFGGFQAINWVDSEGVIRWVSPRAPNRAAEGRSPYEHPVARFAIAAARDERRPHLTPPLQLFQGGRAFTTYFPVHDEDGALRGFVNGVFNIDRLVRDSLGAMLDSHELVLRDGAELAFGDPRLLELRSEQGVTASATLELLDTRRWTVTMAPKPATLSALRGRHHVPYVVVALVLSTALAVLVRFVLVRQLERQRSLQGQARLEQRLHQSRKMEAIGQLAGGVAHDFNNLLTSILGNASFLAESSGLPDAALDSVSEIRLAGERAAALTAQLLAFSRKQVVRRRRLDPNRELRTLHAMLQRLVREDVFFSVELAEGVGTVVIDPVEMSQVTMNLVANAVDAMPEGGALELSTRSESVGPGGEEGCWVVLGVRDSGVGMDEATQRRAFEPFFTTKSPGEGTGMGLATVYGIAIDLGGSVTIESTPGRGTAVDVWLPATREAPDEERRESVGRPRPRGSVLVVEDEAAVRRVAVELLRRSGMEVTEARNGREALETIDDGAPFDVLVTDAVMPELGGVELARHVRRRRPELRVVLCSGYSEVDQAQLDEIDALFVTKPYTAASLLAAVQAQLPSVGARGS